MATKKLDIDALIDQSMTGRNLTPGSTVSPALPGTPFKKPQKEAITVRFDEGDYQKLQRAAVQKGTSAAALLRQAAKEIIRAAGTDGGV
jgi:hypothetical protein